MKFLILGCNGMAGHTITLYLKERGHTVIGFARKKSQFVETIIGDACELEKLRQSILQGFYDCIVNCIGVLNQFAEGHKADAVFLNAYLPHYLEKITKEMPETQIIHISTDCVFSGTRGGYTEYDFRDGETFYDRTKALGELENEKDFTLRTSIIGPDLDPNGIGLLNWFMRQKENVYGYKRVIWTGITTLELSKIVEVIGSKKLYGLYNVVPSTSITKYELLILCNDILRAGKGIVLPVEQPIIDKSLINKKKGLNFNVPDYAVMIKDLSDWLVDKKRLYPHYDL